MNSSTSVTPPAAWTLLRRGPFARYMAGETVSMLGTWMQLMAQGWVMATLTTSAFTLGLVNFASGMPMLLLTMWGGVAADRYDKRWILLAALTVQAALALVIGWIVGRGEIAVWHILAAGICLGVVTAFEMPAASALVPELVAREEIPAAIAVDRSIFHATRLAGPAIGGWLVGWLGTASAFFANAASFSAMATALLTNQPRARGTAEEEAQRQGGMKEGLAYVRADPPTLAMISLLALSTVFISPFFMVMMPLYSMHVLHLRPEQHGILMASSGIGAFVGSVWLLSIRRERRTAWLHAALGAIVVAMLGLAAAQRLSLAVLAMIMLTLGTSTVFGLANTIVQERAPGFIRGRVSALVGLSFFGVLPFAGLLTTWVADRLGLRTALGGAALCYGVCAALLLYTQHRARAARTALLAEKLEPAEL